MKKNYVGVVIMKISILRNKLLYYKLIVSFISYYDKNERPTHRFPETFQQILMVFKYYAFIRFRKT